tara:strand:+ start:1283 stop:1861 length:579 start_codon:yes stop_codon:yes gene_type:complete
MFIRRLIIYLFLTCFFQVQAKTEDIREFQIEGISIGDSLLKYVDLKQIKSNSSFHYTSKKFGAYYLELEDSDYDGLQIDFENSSDYIIEGFGGKIFFKGNFMEKCLIKEKEILSSIKEILKSKAIYIDNGITPHDYDKSGKSVGSWHSFKFNDGSGFINLECMDWSDEIDFEDNLELMILSKKFQDFVNENY